MQPAAALYMFVGFILFDFVYGGDLQTMAMLNTLRFETRDSIQDLAVNRVKFIDNVTAACNRYRNWTADDLRQYYKQEISSFERSVNSTDNRTINRCLHIANMEMWSILKHLDLVDCNKSDFAPVQKVLDVVSLDTGDHIIAEIDSLTLMCCSQNGTTFEKCVKKYLPAKVTMLANFREKIEQFKQSSEELLNDNEKFQSFGNMVSDIRKIKIPRFIEISKNCLSRIQKPGKSHG